MRKRRHNPTDKMQSAASIFTQVFEHSVKSGEFARLYAARPFQPQQPCFIHLHENPAANGYFECKLCLTFDAYINHLRASGKPDDALVANVLEQWVRFSPQIVPVLMKINVPAGSKMGDCMAIVGWRSDNSSSQFVTLRDLGELINYPTRT